MWTSFFNTIKILFLKYKILKFLMFFMILGSVIGSLFANQFLDEESYSALSNFISSFFTDYSANILSNNYSFFGAFFKNIKYFITIWILGFVSYGAFFIFCLIFLKGISYGFTMAFFVIKFGILGILYACSFYFLQNIILIPCYFYVALKAFTFSVKKLYLYKNSCYLRKYVFIFLGILILTILVSFFDVFICPKITGIFI